jgi:hypothetical protein
MVKQKGDIEMVLEETLQEVSESNNIHIRTVGQILVSYGMNNMENIQRISDKLKDRGITIVKG